MIGIYRTQFLAAMERATSSVEPVRRATRERYLKWLTDLETAVKGKDKSLEAVIATEKKRVAPPESGGAK